MRDWGIEPVSRYKKGTLTYVKSPNRYIESVCIRVYTYTRIFTRKFDNITLTTNRVHKECDQRNSVLWNE